MFQVIKADDSGPYSQEEALMRIQVHISYASLWIFQTVHWNFY